MHRPDAQFLGIVVIGHDALTTERCVKSRRVASNGASGRFSVHRSTGAPQAGSGHASKCHPVLASKATDFFDSFNNARDFTVSPQKGRRSHA
jgi:hypothetical protein